MSEGEMSISLRSITKTFPSKDSNGPMRVLDNIDLEVPNGSIVALFGPNGCGKTTILNIIAHIETPDSGISADDGDGTQRPLFGYAFQNFRDVLLPWESALDNVAFPLRASGVTRSAARQQASSFLNAHGFTFPRENYPYQLSIGQQQAVALARVLMQHPVNVLLDEPFSALDHEARFRMQDVMVEVQATAATAIVFVSHDIDEALYLSDELVLLSKRPARVVERYPVPFPRPRRHDLLASTEFTALRREVLAAFLKEVQA